MDFEKGNKVIIKNTDDLWDGKRGKVISQEDDIVTVKINFETEDGTESVIQEFNKENLEMERENESLNESLTTDEKEFFKNNFSKYYKIISKEEALDLLGAEDYIHWNIGDTPDESVGTIIAYLWATPEYNDDMFDNEIEFAYLMKKGNNIYVAVDDADDNFYPIEPSYLRQQLDESVLTEKLPAEVVQAISNQTRHADYNLSSLVWSTGIDLENSECTEITKDEAKDLLKKGERNFIILGKAIPLYASKKDDFLTILYAPFTSREYLNRYTGKVQAIAQAIKDGEKFYVIELKSVPQDKLDQRQEFKDQGVITGSEGSHARDWSPTPDKERERDLKAGANKTPVDWNSDEFVRGREPLRISRYNASFNDLQKNMKQYRELKQKLDWANRDLAHAQHYAEINPKYDKQEAAAKKKRIERLKAEIKQLQTMLKAEQAKPADTIASNIATYQGKVDAVQNEINTLLRRPVTQESFEGENMNELNESVKSNWTSLLNKLDELGIEYDEGWSDWNPEIEELIRIDDNDAFALCEDGICFGDELMYWNERFNALKMIKTLYENEPDNFPSLAKVFNESLNESLIKEEKEKPEDIIRPYIYLEDLDEKEIPAWNFAARIACAEDIEEGCVCELAHELGYKIFVVEAPGVFRTVIAAKGIKAEDIQQEYADFLQGRAHVREIE